MAKGAWDYINTRVQIFDTRKQIFHLHRFKHDEVSISRSALCIAEKKKFSDVAKEVIRTIHGITELFTNVDLRNLEIYIGRASFDLKDKEKSYKYLNNRFNNHKKSKEHDFGIVVCYAESERVYEYESCAVRLLKQLQEKNNLCVGNFKNSKHDINEDISTNHSLIYITFKIIEDGNEYQKPARKIIDAIGTILAQEYSIISDNEIKKGLIDITDPRKKDDLRWATYALVHLKET